MAGGPKVAIEINDTVLPELSISFCQIHLSPHAFFVPQLQHGICLWLAFSGTWTYFQEESLPSHNVFKCNSFSKKINVDVEPRPLPNLQSKVENTWWCLEWVSDHGNMQSSSQETNSLLFNIQHHKKETQSLVLEYLRFLLIVKPFLQIC